ncbi:MAG TPA: hypothetical protein VG963_04775 [Polyangiaceae bacterium]|nr:hypothetical protein [Polyangiaceae bacterium]
MPVRAAAHVGSDRAAGALDHGCAQANGAGALEAVDRYDGELHGTSLNDEAALLRIEALSALGRRSEASALATVYRASDGSTAATGARGNPLVMGAEGSVVGLTDVGFTSLQLSRWTRAGGLQQLGELPVDINLTGLTSAPSRDVVVGVSDTPEANAVFRWTHADGVQMGLPGLESVANGSSLTLSRDGSTLAGYLQGTDVFRLFSWTPSGGTVLGILPAGYLPLGAVPKPARTPTPLAALKALHAFRWTQQSGSVVLIPGIRSEASLMSADGRIIMGEGSRGTDSVLFRAVLPDGECRRSHLRNLGRIGGSRYLHVPLGVCRLRLP